MLLETIERQTGDNPQWSVIWLHGASNGELTSARWLIENPSAVHRPVPHSTCRVTRNGVSAPASIGRSRARSIE